MEQYSLQTGVINHREQQGLRYLACVWVSVCLSVCQQQFPHYRVQGVHERYQWVENYASLKNKEA